MPTSPDNTATADPNMPLPAGATTDGWTSVNPDGALVEYLVVTPRAAAYR